MNISEDFIICPNCSTKINLDEITRLKYNEELKKNNEKLQADFELQKEELKKTLEKEREKDKEELRKKAQEWAEKKAEEKIKEKEIETKDLKNQVDEMKKKQEESIKQELELRKKTRELEEKAKFQELENLKKLEEEKVKIKEEMEKGQMKFFEEKIKLVEEDYKKREQEKDKKLEQLQKSLEDANRKALQGSQQIQGDIQENELKNILSRSFPFDLIEDVPTGIKGADLIQTVRNGNGQKIGVILWESKNTKSWSNDWIKKLKDDRIIVKADVCIIVSSVVPEEIKHFGLLQDIWITEMDYFLPLTVLIRDKLISLHNLSISQSGKQDKMELLYNYLGSSDFKSKIENIIGAFVSMKEELDTEKRSMARIWAKREKELERIINSTSMLYGDMQGIMGNTLQKIDYLELDSGLEE